MGENCVVFLHIPELSQPWEQEEHSPPAWPNVLLIFLHHDRACIFCALAEL